MQHKVLIVGLGLCGTWLSYYLEQANIPFIVFDDGQPNSSTRIASGIVNPVTGRRMVPTWLVKELLPFVEDAYASMQALAGPAGSRPMLQKTAILDFFSSPDRCDNFKTRAEQSTDYLSWPENQHDHEAHFQYHLGYGIISPVYQICLPDWLAVWRSYLVKKGRLVEQHFEPNEITITDDEVRMGSHSGTHLIFANGAAAAQSGYFQLLPFAPNKGEALLLDIPNLPDTYIFKKGFVISPWKDGLFWAGSVYNRDFENEYPSTSFRQEIEAWLQQFLKHSYTVVDHLAAIRPTTLERRPFVGWHPQHTHIGILNGMGTKGVSLAPYFAQQLVGNMLHGLPIHQEANVERYSQILRR